MPRKIKPGKIAFNHDIDEELVRQFREFSKRMKDPYVSITLERAMRREMASPIDPHVYPPFQAPVVPMPPAVPLPPKVPPPAKKKPGRPKKDSK